MSWIDSHDILHLAIKSTITIYLPWWFIYRRGETQNYLMRSTENKAARRLAGQFRERSLSAGLKCKNVNSKSIRLRSNAACPTIKRNLNQLWRETEHFVQSPFDVSPTLIREGEEKKNLLWFFSYIWTGVRSSFWHFWLEYLILDDQSEKLVIATAR